MHRCQRQNTILDSQQQVDILSLQPPFCCSAYTAHDNNCCDIGAGNKEAHKIFDEAVVTVR